jgi:quinol monooxygenase YgiN
LSDESRKLNEVESGARMVLRIFRARVYPEKRAVFARFLREEAVPNTRAQPGLVDCWAGEPLRDQDDEFVFVSIWRDLASLQAFRGTDLDDPGILPHEVDVIREAVVEHYAT